MQVLTTVLALRDRMSQALTSPLERLQLLNNRLETLGTSDAMTNMAMQASELTGAVANIDTDGIGDIEINVSTDSLSETIEHLHQLQSAIDNIVANPIEETLDTLQNKQEVMNGLAKGQSFFNRMLNKGSSAIKKKFANYVNIRSIIKGIQKQFSSLLNAVEQRQAIEIPLIVSMRNMGATRDEIAGFIQDTQALQDRFAFSNTAFMAGATELARAVSDTSYINKLTTALADMTAGIAGINATDQDMAAIAGELAQALQGNYRRLEQKGIVLSESQQYILAYGTELERIVVLSDAVSRSFGGLAEALAQTPAGKLLQVRNAVADIRLELGQQLQPAWLSIVSQFYAHMPYITMLMEGIGNAAIAVTQWFASSMFPVLLNGFSSLVTGAMWFYNVLTNNWGMIQPVIYGIIGALAVLLAKKTAVAIGAKAVAVAQALMAIAFVKSSAGVWKLNTALIKKNVLLGGIPMLIGAVVAGIAFWVQSVGSLRVAWLITMDNIINAWDVTSNGLMAGFNWVTDGLDYMQMMFRSVGVHIANHVDNMGVNVLNILENMINGSIDLLNRFIETINHLPMVHIDTVQHVSFVAGAAIEAEARRYERELNLEQQRQDMVDGIQARADALNNRRYNQYLARQERQLGIEQARLEASERQNLGLNENTPFDALTILMNGFYNDVDPWDRSTSGYYNDMLGYTKNIAQNTGDLARKVNISDEDLRHFRDVAVRESINNVTYTVNPTFSINIDNVNGEDSQDIKTIVKEAVDEVMDEYGWSDEDYPDGQYVFGGH